MLQGSPSQPPTIVVRDFQTHEACLFAGYAMQLTLQVLSDGRYTCVNRTRELTSAEIARQGNYP
ncbi:hypothetical protein [EBPR siphovirus 2]|nr:hypothetical protein [EBPR siphovirus 2]